MGRRLSAPELVLPQAPLTGAGAAMSTGMANTLIGEIAGSAVTSGNANEFLGAGAGQSVTTGSNNIAIGLNALSLANSSRNVAIGTNAGANAGNGNIFIGWDTGELETGSNKL